MLSGEAGRCIICREPARRDKPVHDVNAFNIDCAACGKYQVGGGTEAQRLAIPDPQLDAWLPRIADANARGMRVRIYSATETPLLE